MKKLVILLILLAAVVFTAGCTDESQKNSTIAQGNQDINGTVKATEPEQNTTLQKTQNESSVAQVTNLEQINASLKQGPVLMKIGSKHCGPCQAMRPMLKELATEYSGRATIVSIDITESPDLATYFNIAYVPDTTLIMGIKNGKYVYLQEDGQLTTDRLKARIRGQMEKEVYEERINLALQKEKSTS
jgi:Thiol-disulfide isomerase and thioredoxins